MLFKKKKRIYSEYIREEELLVPISVAVIADLSISRY
jgi:hypothetical protein